jgi:hypothetical protein
MDRLTRAMLLIVSLVGSGYWVYLSYIEIDGTMQSVVALAMSVMLAITLVLLLVASCLSEGLFDGVRDMSI